MSAFVPPPSRRVLTTLLGEVAWSAEIEPGNETTPVERALRDLLDALAAHEAALVELDRLEDAVVAAHGYPRVPLPADLASPGLAYAADPRTIERRLGQGLQARRLKAELRRRQAVVREAAAAAGLPAARAREAVTARVLGAAGVALIIAPCQTLRDLQLKLAVVIAAGEAGPDDATAFPWWCLRVLAVDMSPSSCWLEPRA
ncbi:UNVERIFIED_ORG: hypothetical protein M2438_001970 [Methylobacterium sp. SuP10 SLI 274]|uniref:hypothetical protein n=1 Tax=Methylorubrum extorquens TaxID=408 RepID=UPI0020A03A49|nr:hypothetical protein [Methylorubrum extorquens]MDF9863183.1 hypothetical protein [Methylorubrum pseudosasae]MDH6636795.1 hypothetical protein [Methylobacterium sp. SuP10 SLI 274]MDH6665972.1 hypothetical protein [Methylorubrum zatmanii]MCP1557886.1 hypothetical protein [Methylorubrum extorquens]MDF9791489.1 hypothetical protein [Methylorubrum extorquens]